MKFISARVAEADKPKEAFTASCTVASFVFRPNGVLAIVNFDGERILRPILMSKPILDERL